MIRRRTDAKKQYQTYPDGHCTICKATDRRLVQVKQENVHFAESTVGERRYWDAARALGTKIVKMLIVPYQTNVDADDIVLIGDRQFEVKQKQRYDRTVPVSWLLSLSETAVRYRSDLDGS